MLLTFLKTVTKYRQEATNLREERFLLTQFEGAAPHGRESMKVGAWGCVVLSRPRMMHFIQLGLLKVLEHPTTVFQLETKYSKTWVLSDVLYLNNNTNQVPPSQVTAETLPSAEWLPRLASPLCFRVHIQACGACSDVKTFTNPHWLSSFPRPPTRKKATWRQGLCCVHDCSFGGGHTAGWWWLITITNNDKISGGSYYVAIVLLSTFNYLSIQASTTTTCGNYCYYSHFKHDKMSIHLSLP